MNDDSIFDVPTECMNEAVVHERLHDQIQAKLELISLSAGTPERDTSIDELANKVMRVQRSTIVHVTRILERKGI